MTNDLNQCVRRISNFPDTYRKEDLTPSEIKDRSGYVNYSSQITENMISQYLRTEPSIVNDWIVFTEDIRHTPAWGFGPIDNGKWTVTLIDNGVLKKEYHYDNQFDGCAKMIIQTIQGIN